MPRRIAVLCASATVFACLALAGVANAEPTSISGSVPNGGCDAARPVTVSGPSRIEIQVSSTSASNSVFGEIVSSDGRVLATDSYDTPSGGTYGVRVCSWFDSLNPPSMQYTGRYATGPAGQPALPRAEGGVAGAQTTLSSRDVHGSGAIKTRMGLAWFTVKTNRNGVATVRVFVPRLKVRYLFTGATATFGTNTVQITRGTMKLTLVDRGSTERLAFRSAKLKASGRVVRGGYIII